ncbi:MAG: hypothetical protein AMXMBFR84_37010 [Candidatus Hydrogenedentota bacterium]
MIRINLLPHHLRPIKRTPLPYILSGAVLVVAVLAVASNFIAIRAQLASKQGQLQNYQAELDELDAIIKESDRLESLKVGLAEKIATIDEIVRDRIIWSRELYNLSRLLPKNMWFRRVEVTKRSFTERVPDLDPKGMPKVDPNTKQPIMKEIRRDRPILRVSGYVTDTITGSDDLTPFIANVSDDSEFTARFTLEPPELGSTTFEGFEVNSFSLDFLIEEGGNQ